MMSDFLMKPGPITEISTQALLPLFVLSYILNDMVVFIHISSAPHASVMHAPDTTGPARCTSRPCLDFPIPPVQQITDRQRQANHQVPRHYHPNIAVSLLDHLSKESVVL